MDNAGDRPPSREYFRGQEFASCLPSAKMATRKESTPQAPPPSHCCLCAAQSAPCAAGRKHPAGAHWRWEIGLRRSERAWVAILSEVPLRHNLDATSRSSPIPSDETFESVLDTSGRAISQQTPRL